MKCEKACASGGVVREERPKIGERAVRNAVSWEWYTLTFAHSTSACSTSGTHKHGCVTVQVLQHVRLPLLSPKFLVGTVSSELLIRSDDACRDLLDEAKNYLLLPQERPLMQGPRTRPRKPTRRGTLHRHPPTYLITFLCFLTRVTGFLTFFVSRDTRILDFLETREISKSCTSLLIEER